MLTLIKKPSRNIETTVKGLPIYYNHNEINRHVGKKTNFRYYCASIPDLEK